MFCYSFSVTAMIDTSDRVGYFVDGCYDFSYG